MNLKKLLKGIFAGTSGRKPPEYRRLSVKCGRCGAVFEVGYRPGTDIQWGVNDEPGVAGILRKEAMDGECYQPVTITLSFDARRSVVRREIEGGDFVF